MFKNIFYNTRTSKMHLWEQVNGKNLYSEEKWVPYVYEITDEQSTIKTIEGNTAKKIEFDTYNEYYLYQKDHPNCKENFIKPEIQFLAERYHGILDDEIENPKLKVCSLDIEVNITGREFPKPSEAKEPVVLISVNDMSIGRTTSFGIKAYTGKYKDEKWLTYVHCTDEENLLRQFFLFMHREKFDVMSGWNCVPVRNYILKSNEISRLSDIKINDSLPLSNNVELIYPKSMKMVNKIKLANGGVLDVSKDHIIPITHINNGLYTKLYENNDILIKEEVKVCKIPFKEKSCFVKIPMGLNKNNDCDLDDKLVYLAGLIYTDGTLRDKKIISNGYRVYQSNLEILEKIPYITTKIGGNKKKGYRRSVKYSLMKELHSFIYNEKGEKSLNINLLSRLSKKQFYYFLSGFLDGDGISSSVGISLCDFTKDGIDKLYNLCLWNGIFVTKGKNRLHLIEYDVNMFRFNHPYRWLGMKVSSLNRTSSQKASQIRFKKIDNDYYVRIIDIEETEEFVEMVDIKTNSGYFITNGVTVHNCTNFDFQYLINRVERITGDSSMYSFLSPIKTVKMWNQKESDDVNIDIAGSTILDYLELYKWYSPIKRERYTLDFISKSELSKGKVDYSEYNDLRQLYNDNWNLYVEYNIIDAYRVSQLEEKLGYIKLIQTLSLLTKVPMKYYRTQTTLIEGIFLTHFRRNGMCAPTFYGGVQESFEAAWVKEPQKGLYKWVSDLDITSSYPSAIITLNMSIETYYGRILGITEDQMMIYVKDRKFPNFDLHKDTGKININGKRLDLFNMALSKGMLCVAPCGSVFSTTTPGIISTVERIAFEKRIAVKRKMNDLKKTYEFLKPEELPTIKEKVARYHGLQNALKTILNSMYGATATPYSRYFNKNMSEAVVSCGRQTIKAANGFVNELLNNPTKELLDIFNEINT